MINASKLLLLVFLQTVLAFASGAAFATPTLTAAAGPGGLGFTISQFAYNFPMLGSPCCGPLGIAFLDSNKVMVSDYPGNVRIFQTDSDGQNAATATIAANYGNQNAVGLARLGNFVYMTQQATGKVVQLKLDGTFNADILSGASAIPTATGIVADTHTNKLFVSDCCSGTGIWIVDPATNSKSLFRAGNYDGLSLSSDGSILYAEVGQHVIGFKTSDPNVVVFDSGFISGADGTELGAGILAGKIFVNTNFGELWEVDLLDASIKTLIVQGGSRGDFVTADPNNGSLLFTQSSDIWRLTAPLGGCIGAACNTVPEPGSIALFGLALAGVAAIRRRKQS
jgi:hypothetical protein